MYLQINMVKYDVDQEITNIYENLQIVQSHFFTDMLLFVNIRLLQISIGLSVFGFVANKYKQIAIWSLLAIPNTWSNIQWTILKVKTTVHRLKCKGFRTQMTHVLEPPACLNPVAAWASESA